MAAKKAKPEEVSTAGISKTPADIRRARLSALNSIKKKHGSEAVVSNEKRGYEVVPTGSLKIDAATGIGGLPRGRVVELYGIEAAGKTSLTMSVMAQAQKKYVDESVGFIDMEHAFDLEYAEQFGVDLDEDKFTMTQPDNGVQALDILYTLVESCAYSVIIVDSVAGLTTDREDEGEVGQQFMGEQARLLSPFMRKLVPIVKKTNTLVIFINQLRSQIGPYSGGPITMGGKALKHAASMRIMLKRTDLITVKDDTIGQVQNIKFEKNKCGKPFKETSTNLLFGKGYDPFSEIVEVCIENGIISQGGAWYTYPIIGGEFYKVCGKVGVIDFYKGDLAQFNFLKNILEESYKAVPHIEDDLDEHDPEFLDAELS